MSDETLAANEAYVREKTAAGEVADFTKREGYDAEAKPKISAAFLRRLMLGLERDGDGNAVKPLLPGVRVRGAFVDGELDLSDCAGAGGAGLPALALEACDLPGRVNLSAARLARLSLRGSRFAALWGEGLKLDGDFDFRSAKPAPAAIGGDDAAYIRLRAARIDGDIWALGAMLRAPGAIPEGMERKPDALDLQSATVGGAVYLRAEGEAHFEALGCVSLYGAKIGGDLDCSGGRFSHPGGNALLAQSAEIGGAVLLRAAGAARFEAEGRVSLPGAKIGGTLACDGGRFSNPGGDALQAANAEIGGNVLLRAEDEARFEAEGCVFLLGAKIGGNLEFKDATLADAGWALFLQNARIEGQLLAWNNEVSGAVSLAGARIRRLYDDPQTGWGGAKAKDLIELNDIDLDRIGALDNAPRPLWRARAAWLRRNTGDVQQGWAKPRFSNQPWRQVAAAFERAGLHGDARRIRREEQREANKERGKFLNVMRAFVSRHLFDSDWNSIPVWRRVFVVIATLVSIPFVFLYAKLKQTFVWLFAEQMFGFGLSVSRATATAIAFWLLGWAGASLMEAKGVLAAAQAPDKPAMACQNFQPGLYALDVMIPILDLGQESQCAPGRAPHAKDLAPGVPLVFNNWVLFEEIAVWSWAKALYGVFGAAIVGFALLTYTGVFKPRAEP